MCNECVDSEKGDKEEDKASPGQCAMNVLTVRKEIKRKIKLHQDNVL